MSPGEASDGASAVRGILWRARPGPSGMANLQSTPGTISDDVAGGGARSGGFFLLAEVDGYAVDDFVERGLGTEAGQGVEFIDAGDAAHHVLETRFVGLIVRDEFDRGRAARALFDQLSETFDGDL